jgi:hypothetical protein
MHGATQNELLKPGKCFLLKSRGTSGGETAVKGGRIAGVTFPRCGPDSTQA